MKSEDRRSSSLMPNVTASSSSSSSSTISESVAIIHLSNVDPSETGLKEEEEEEGLAAMCAAVH